MLLRAEPSVKYEIIHETISNDDNLLTIGLLCEIAGVSRSGYYWWVDAEKTRIVRERQDEDDFALILEAYNYRGYNKGARGIHMRLLHRSEPIVMNIKKIRRLMKKYNLRCLIRRANPYRRLSKAMKTNRVAPNILNRAFKKYGPRTVLLTDVTYIPRRSRTEEGPDKYSYLSVIMDAYTKEILSYILSLSLDVDFVLKTVRQLMDKHGHELKTNVLIHSDQGCHYTSHKFIEIINDSELRQSMSRKANCWDNAPQESLFGHMKDEIHVNPSDAHQAIKTKVDDWVEYYNNERYQWSLAKLAPSEFYKYLVTGDYPLPISPPPLAEPDTISFDIGETTDDA